MAFMAKIHPCLVKTPPGSPSSPSLGVGLESLVWLADSMGSLEEHLVTFFLPEGGDGWGGWEEWLSVGRVLLFLFTLNVIAGGF